jgi:hypothetical protein
MTYMRWMTNFIILALAPATSLARGGGGGHFGEPTLGGFTAGLAAPDSDDLLPSKALKKLGPGFQPWKPSQEGDVTPAQSSY